VVVEEVAKLVNLVQVELAVAVEAELLDKQQEQQGQQIPEVVVVAEELQVPP